MSAVTAFPLQFCTALENVLYTVHLLLYKHFGMEHLKFKRSKTHFKFNIFSPPENRVVYEKYGTAMHATDNNTAHALWMPDNEAYSHTYRIFNLLLSHGNKGYANAAQCCVILYINYQLDALIIIYS